MLKDIGMWLMVAALLYAVCAIPAWILIRKAPNSPWLSPRRLMWMIIAGNTADWATTCLAITYFGAYEANPFLAPFFHDGISVWFHIIKLILMNGGCLMLTRGELSNAATWVGTKGIDWRIAIFTVAITFGLIVGSNTFLIFHELLS